MSNTVKTQEEYNEVESNLAKMAMSRLGITERAARLRVRAIVKSGIMGKFGPPTSMPFMVAIDAAMQIPQYAESEEDWAEQRSFEDKAAKWDALGDQIALFYTGKDDEDYDADRDDEGLLGIGEAAASAFGYL